jgi:dTMP kinase
MLIALEGIDGAGKRTQALMLKEGIGHSGLAAEIISFPRYGETIFARSIADYLNGRMGELRAIDPHLPALLYAGDRLESRDLLLCASERADVLILDRYTASNAAYQSARLHPDQRWDFIHWITEIEHGAYQLPHADRTIFLDLPVKTASQLVANKGQRDYTDRGADIHEQDQRYLSECREVYRMLADAQFGSVWSTVRCTSDDGTLLSAAAIHEAIWQAVADSVPAARGLKSQAS